uniref:RNA-directed RNA polymerase C-terminal domain-containing protein n=1 Tax=Solemoviridae sp. TaxID=2715208 RepID=A0A6M3YPN3_9VIRU|nr:MAG: hypothetical protein 2 [Solemoviridae sp.]
MTSSPGYPYMREATTNAQWLKWDGIRVDEIQKQRLWMDVQDVIKGDLESYLRVFIKQEPHKRKKILEKRWRLIVASSLPVQIVWHMLFDYQNDLEIDEAFNIPSQQGILLVKGGWRQYYRSWSDRGLTCGLDKSAWDWTAPKWAIDLDLELRRRLCRGGMVDEWERIAKSLYRDMFEDPKLILSDGTVYQQVVPGIMKSGCVNTISTNSHCQIFLHMAVCLDNNWPITPLPVCCGDDTLQAEEHVSDLDAYRKYGVVVKSASTNVEFVGHEFSAAGPQPMYILKHVMKAQYTSDEILPQYLDSMARMYVHSPYYNIWEALSKALCIQLPMSRNAYQYWYDFDW